MVGRVWDVEENVLIDVDKRGRFGFHYSLIYASQRKDIRPWNFGNERYPEIDTTFSLSQASERETKTSPCQVGDGSEYLARTEQ